ncbi:hypothetical protein Tco_0411377 [Tanacetum coccineum]
MQERLDLNKSQGASTPEEVKRMQNVPYASVVGSIMYAVRCTRPDVLFAQNITSRFQQNPGEPHWTAVKNILKDDIKSKTRYVFVLNGGTVDWKSSKKSTTAMSATEAEYIAASEAAMEAVWIRKFILVLGIVPTINEPIKMLCDNSAALLIANESGHLEKKRDEDTTLQDFDGAWSLHCVEMTSQFHLTPSHLEGDDVTIFGDVVAIADLRKPEKVRRADKNNRHNYQETMS